jgi:hypothetical protein
LNFLSTSKWRIPEDHRQGDGWDAIGWRASSARGALSKTDTTHLKSSKLFSLIGWIRIFIFIKLKSIRQENRWHTVAHFIIVRSPKSQVVIFNLNFNMVYGSLLLSPQALWRLKIKRISTFIRYILHQLFNQLLNIQGEALSLPSKRTESSGLLEEGVYSTLITQPKTNARPR